MFLRLYTGQYDLCISRAFKDADKFYSRRMLTPVASVICSRLGLTLREVLQPGVDTEECMSQPRLLEDSLLDCRRALLRTPK